MSDLKNYKKEKLTINIVWANVFGALLIVPILLLFGIPYFLIWKPDINLAEFMDNLLPYDFALYGLVIFGVIMLGIVVHELIHGLTWAPFAKKGMKSIKFGVIWNMLTPYCHCKEPLTVKQYILGAITPAIILGIVPAIIGIITGNFWMLLFGMFFTQAAGGDILMINLIRKEDGNDLVQDHPSEVGCYIYRKTTE